MSTDIYLGLTLENNQRNHTLLSHQNCHWRVSATLLTAEIETKYSHIKFGRAGHMTVIYGGGAISLWDCNYN